MNQVLLVADGTNLTHRCYHASGGQAMPETVMSMVARMLQDAAGLTGATHALVAFDGPNAGAPRYVIHPGYKAGRAAKTPELSATLTKAPELMAQAGWGVHREDGVEADDILAHYAQDPSEAVLVTSDKDALALLIHSGTVILRPGKAGVKWEEVTALNLEELTGITPAQWSLYAALKGDSSDMIPGVKGLGPKYATALAKAHADAEAFLEDLRKGGPVTAQTAAKSKTAWLCANLGDVETAVRLSLAMVKPLPVHSPPDLAAVPARAARPEQVEPEDESYTGGRVVHLDLPRQPAVRKPDSFSDFL